MARTTADLLEQLYRWIPEDRQTADPLFGGLAAVLREGEVVTDALSPLTTIGGAFGTWLDLHADGYGMPRASSSELDPEVRTRLRNVDDSLTPTAITAAVNRLLLPYGVTCRLIEWFHEPWLHDTGEADALWLDSTYISGGSRTFLIVVPQIDGAQVSFGTHLDVDFWLDSDAFFGAAGPWPSVYTAIVREVERLRAAGVAWRLVIEE